MPRLSQGSESWDQGSKTWGEGLRIRGKGSRICDWSGPGCEDLVHMFEDLRLEWDRVRGLDSRVRRFAFGVGQGSGIWGKALRICAWSVPGF